MDFSISDASAERLARARALIDEVITPLEDTVLKEGFENCQPALEAARDKVRAAGFWAPQAPANLGGLGLTLVEHGQLSEVMGRSFLGHYCFGSQAPDAGNIEVLEKFGSDAQKEKWLPDLVGGRIRSCFSLTEPGQPGSNPTELDTHAELKDGKWTINGRKWFSTAADGATIAIIMAVTEPDAPRHRRASMFLVPTNTPGFEHVRKIPIMGTPGAGWLSHSEIAYSDMVVDEDALIGDRGAGFVMAQERLGPGRVHHCMRWLGICERAFDLMVDRAASRDLGGGTMLGDSAIIQAWISESRAEINAARLMVLEAAWTIDREGFAAARDSISLIKFHVAGVLQRVVDRAIQAHGALGITDDLPLAFFYSHERGSRIYDGPDEVHKVSFAKRLLKRAKKRLAEGT